MELKKIIEEHPIRVYGGTLLLGFIAGWGAHIALQQTANLEPISKERVSRIGEIEKENETLKIKVEQLDKQNAKAMLMNNNSIPIESLPLTTVAYGGEAEPDGKGKGSGRLSISRYDIYQARYILDYWLPNEGNGYAGLAFLFSAVQGSTKYQDLSKYEHIEMTIDFGGEQIRCYLEIKDASGKSGRIRLGDNVYQPKDTVVTINGNERKITVPLKTNFSSIDWKIVNEIGFVIDTDFSRGEHRLIINSIKLLNR